MEEEEEQEEEEEEEEVKLWDCRRVESFLSVLKAIFSRAYSSSEYRLSSHPSNPCARTDAHKYFRPSLEGEAGGSDAGGYIEMLVTC